MRLQELAARLGVAWAGNPDCRLERVSPFETAEAGSLTLAVGKHRENLSSSQASAFIVAAASFSDAEAAPHSFLLSPSPKVTFAQAIALLHVPPYQPQGIAPDFICGLDTEIGTEVSIYPRVTVGKNCRIGNRVTLHPGVVIGDCVEIGDETTLFANVSIYHHVSIGRRVVLHAGTVIGSDGFGFAQDATGNHIKMPQVGDVVIEDEVEMGANCCVDRGTLGTTRIGRGTKLDNLVHIAHNCEVGEHTLMAAQVGLSGSVKVGHHVTLAGQVGTNPHVEIGDGALVAGKSGVSKSVAAGGQYSGMPIQTLKEWKLTHIFASQLHKRLPQLEKRVKTLEAQSQPTGSGVRGSDSETADGSESS
ncbi:MAG: UDP-3-O-(3-hydroxymyristoyl)glucosamine N-acyltransferase [Blastocatellia bacterium]|nr:UDP-3-O-(3-hydroxymyristoyl)glucosamine N-acyltransferase [Blastocatellia bacterium]